MRSVTDLKHLTSERHVELGTSRSTRDYEDIFNEPNLHSLSSGLSAADGDIVMKQWSESSQATRQGECHRCFHKRKHQVHSFDHLLPGIQNEDSPQPSSACFLTNCCCAMRRHGSIFLLRAHIVNLPVQQCLEKKRQVTTSKKSKKWCWTI